MNDIKKRGGSVYKTRFSWGTRSFRMSWFVIAFFLSLTFNSLSEASHDKKLPSAVVVGTVYCDTCFQEDFSKTSHFISGASVAVECKDGLSKTSFREEVKTDEHGEFKVHLPFSVGKHIKKIEGCSVKLISSSEPYCAVASTATSSSLHLKSRKEGTHIFSAGFFTFKPLKQPNLCNQKPDIQNSRELISKKSLNSPSDDFSFPPPLQDPAVPILPPLPKLPELPPLPQLPPLLPPLPGLPFPPIPGKTTKSKPTESSKTTQLADQKAVNPQFFFPPLLPPIPGLTPPPLLPPIPGLTPPPLIPNPFQPPPAPLIPIPPIPGLTPPAGPAPLIPLPPIPGLTPPPGPAPLIPIPPIPPIPGLTPSPPPPAPLIPLPPIPGLTPSPSPPAGPAPLFPFPPIPGLTPSPPLPPPPTPSLPFPFPPIFPFPPSPRIPGIPPASSSP